MLLVFLKTNYAFLFSVSSRTVFLSFFLLLLLLLNSHGLLQKHFLTSLYSLHSTPYYAQTFIFLLSQGESLNFTGEQQLFSSSSSLIFDAVVTRYKDKNLFISVITIKAKLLFYVTGRQCLIILGPG